MNPDETVGGEKPADERDPSATRRISRQDEPESVSPTPVSEEKDAAAAEPSPEPLGWVAQIRQAMQRSPQGEARANIKREQLREDRTKAFLLLAGSTVVLGLTFFALFSSPSSSHKSNSTRPNQPNLGRAPAGEKDSGRSVTPLLNADTRNPDDDTGKLSPQDIKNTARLRTVSRASTAAPQPAAPARDYALNKIQFPSEPAPAPPPAQPEKLNKASLVFVSAGVSTGARQTIPASANTPAYLELQSLRLPPGTRLVARLETPVSTAVKAPVVAAIEYNYDREGEIVIPAGTKAFGEMDQANDHGYVGIRFESLQFPDGGTQPIDGRSMALDYKPLVGKVTGRNTGKKFLVQSLTGLGEILAGTVGVQGGLGVNDTISNNVLLRERLADNVALAGEQQLNDLAYHQNIVVTVPGNTRFFIVLAKPTDHGPATPGSTLPAGNKNTATLAAGSSLPSVQELRELMQLKTELTQMYEQQQRTQPVRKEIGILFQDVLPLRDFGGMIRGETFTRTMYEECQKINRTFGTLVSDLRKRAELHEAALAEALQEFDKLRDHNDPEVRKEASRRLSRARAALRENEERAREEMRDFHVFLSDWGNGKRENRRGWCQALHSLAVASRNDKATGAIVFHAFPQEALDKLLEETGGQPIQLHLPEMPDGEIVFDDTGNVYRVERIRLDGGQTQERRIFLFRVTEHGNIILDGVRVNSVQPFAIQEGSGEIRNGMVTFSNLRQRPTVRNGRPPVLRTREDRERFLAACEERFGSSFSVFVDGDPTSVRQLDTETGKQSFLECAPVRPWEARPFQRAQTIQ